MRWRCLLVDDNEGFLVVARIKLVQEGLDVVGTARTIAEAMQQVQALNPEVVLVDIGLGAESGFDLAWQLVDRHPELRDRIVMVSVRDERDYVDLIEESPVAGFLSKTRLSAGAVRDLVGSQVSSGSTSQNQGSQA